ncbi:amidohydrolase [Stagnihabitans tardus]|uniref:Amidohydrolase family protein n=1 Tax=Stagnihabitans tardus TaxID=2699202 RepID=A0AAE4YG09_9RHOB|nr:amidohydrolase [Stagnihabitans tardus]NBZ89519.1 amidohydrolase family protein [Stagnihabitans tardus]
MEADLIVCGARVITMDAGRPRAEAVAVAGGKIVAVGSDAAVLTLRGKGTRVVQAGGRTLLPGFVESHLHLGLGGSELDQLQLGGVCGFDAVAARVRAYAEGRSDPVLMAQGAGYGCLGAGKPRELLDAIIARPFAMTSPDHHTVWANTACLELCGLLHGAVMPEGHEVVMEDGLATGELREFEAFGPVIEAAGYKRMNVGIATGMEPEGAGAAERAADAVHFKRGLAHCAAHGVTSMVNMDGNLYTLQVLAEIEAAGDLTARVVVPFHMKPTMALSELERASEMDRLYRGDWLRSGFVKMFMDGVVDSRTAYMLRNYPGTQARSVPLFELEQFRDVCAEIDRRGLQIAVHAIGDGAVRQTIDGYEAAMVRNGRRDSRHRIEHIELIDKADIPRLGALGITASVQPPHPPGAMDFPFSPTMEEIIGRDRWDDAYLWRTLKEAGAPVALASDWPVTDISILRGIQAAMTRAVYEGGVDERFTLMEVLHGYTAGGAWAAKLDDVTGMLRIGMAGDLVLLDGDIEATPFAQIGQMGIALTVSAGRVTHQGAGFA